MRISKEIIRDYYTTKEKVSTKKQFRFVDHNTNEVVFECFASNEKAAKKQYQRMRERFGLGLLNNRKQK